jgi:KamA family protein
MLTQARWFGLTWQDEFKKNVSTIDQLKEYLDMTAEEEKILRRVVDIHPMSISRYYLSLIDKNDPDDPIRKMAVPSEEELNVEGSYDTSGEQENTKLHGLQHKYPKTALLLASNVCAMYCRHCFRKRMVGLSNDEIVVRFNDTLEYIASHKEINNVLITGGDPLTLPTEILAHFLDRLSVFPHLDFIRIGSRVPVTFPERLIEDDSLIELLGKHSRPQRRIYVSTHFNHPKEISSEAVEGVSRLVKAGVVLNNQTVLMKGVNDSPTVLADLQNSLAAVGVNPYYVFQCRPVKRVKSHFQLSLVEGYDIVSKAKQYLNGHSKRFRYIMSHVTGKVEIVGIIGDEIYLKYHQAKEPEDMGRFFKMRLTPGAGWLDELQECE